MTKIISAMETGLIQSIIGGLGEYSLGSGAYNLLRPVAGKFALATVPLARAVFSGVSQLFKEESDFQKAIDQAFVGFSDGLGQTLDFAFGSASGLGCALAGGVGNFFSEGAREYTKGHDLRSAVEVGVKSLLLGAGFVGVLGAFTNLRFTRSRVDAPSITDPRSGFNLDSIAASFRDHRRLFQNAGVPTDLLDRLIANIRFISNQNLRETMGDLAGDINRFVGERPYHLVYHGEGSRSGGKVAGLLSPHLLRAPQHTYSVDYSMMSGPSIRIAEGARIVWVDDAIYSGQQVFGDLGLLRANPSDTLIVAGAISHGVLTRLDMERGPLDIAVRYNNPNLAEIFGPDDLSKLAQAYQLLGSDLANSCWDRYPLFFEHGVPDNFPWFLTTPTLRGFLIDTRLYHY